MSYKINERQQKAVKSNSNYQKVYVNLLSYIITIWKYISVYKIYFNNWNKVWPFLVYNNRKKKCREV